MTLTRNPANGLLTGTALGRVTTVQTYNGFGEPATITARLDGAPLLAMSYERDRLGRIVRKEETLGGTTDVYLYSYDLSGRLPNTYDLTTNQVLDTLMSYGLLGGACN